MDGITNDRNKLTVGLTDEAILNLSDADLNSTKNLIEKNKGVIANLEKMNKEKDSILARRKELERQQKEIKTLENRFERAKEEAIDRIKEGMSAKDSLEKVEFEISDAPPMPFMAAIDPVYDFDSLLDMFGSDEVGNHRRVNTDEGLNDIEYISGEIERVTRNIDMRIFERNYIDNRGRRYDINH